MNLSKILIGAIFFFTFFIGNKIVVANPIVEVDSIKEGYMVNNEVGYYVDKALAYDVKQLIQHPELFKQNENGYLSFGYLDRQVWLKFTIHSSVKKRLVLEYHPYHVDTISLFVVKNQTVQFTDQNGINYLKNNKKRISL